MFFQLRHSASVFRFREYEWANWIHLMSIKPEYSTFPCISSISCGESLCRGNYRLRVLILVCERKTRYWSSRDASCRFEELWRCVPLTVSQRVCVDRMLDTILKWCHLPCSFFLLFLYWLLSMKIPQEYFRIGHTVVQSVRMSIDVCSTPSLHQARATLFER